MATGGAGGSGGAGGAGGSPATWTAEAGYLDVRPASVAGPAYPARMFYSFRPCDADPSRAPLVVFFNGGPGAATTGVLMAYGTGPTTLDPVAEVDAPPVANPASWTRFANLLYLDERQAGFSHGVGESGECVPGKAMFLTDAAEFVGAVLDFLDAHEAIRGNSVVLTGESYGGLRAPMMLHLLQTYAGDPGGPIADLPEPATHVPWLAARVQAHFDAVTGGPAGPLAPSAVARQFGWQVLIQPGIAGFLQAQIADPLARKDPDTATFFADLDGLDTPEANALRAADARVSDHVARQIRDPSGFTSLVGVAPEDIVGLGAATRGPSFRLLPPGDPATLPTEEAALRARIGDLGPNDTYWLPWAAACMEGEIGGDGRTLQAFVRELPRTATFITDARFDGLVYSEGLPALFTLVGLDASVDRSAPAGAARPGEIRLAHLADAETGAARDVAIRFPIYDAYHEVSVGAPAPFADDVRAWLAETGALVAP